MDFIRRTILASQRIQSDIRRTALEYSALLSRMFDAEIYLKWESDQLTGSFKLRGAMNKIRSLADNEKRKGVVSASTGNHGLAVSYASKLEGVELTLVLPTTVSPEKRRRLEKSRAKVVAHGLSCEISESYARRLAQEAGRIYVSPYNDEEVIFGQGTVGLEIFKDLPGVGDVLVPVGGGGLIAGIAGYLKSMNPRIRVFGIEPENSAFMAVSLKAGRLVEVEERETIADAVAGGIEPGSITFPLCQEYVNEILLVSENLTKESMRLIFESQGKVVEGAGALSLAGLMRAQEQFQGRRVVLVVSGGNIAAEHFQKIIRK